MVFVFPRRCWSYVGDLKNGKQQISIGSFCYFHGIVVHEIGHALGEELFVQENFINNTISEQIRF